MRRLLAAFAVGVVTAALLVRALAAGRLLQRAPEANALATGEPSGLIPTATPAPPTPRPSEVPEPTSLGAETTAGTLAIVRGSTLFRTDGDALWRYDGESGRLDERKEITSPTVVDDHRVIYIDLVKDARAVWDLRGTNRIVAPAEAHAVDVSQDGEAVAYVTSDWKLFVSHHERPSHLGSPDLGLVNAHWSPSGRLLALERAPLPGTTRARPEFWPEMPSELWLLEVADDRARKLYPASPPPADFCFPTFRFASWSPDDRYIALWETTAVCSGRLDGARLVVIDARSGERTELEAMLMARSWLAWSSPHTLAFASGRGRATCQDKTLRLWSPESGIRALTTDQEVAVSPSWDPDGRSLYFVRSPRANYMWDDYLAGRASGARHLAVVDTRSGVIRGLPQDPRFAEEAVRASRDGARLLVLRRPLGSSAPMELWSLSADGSQGRPLVRLATPGYCYASAWTIFERVAWSR